MIYFILSFIYLFLHASTCTLHQSGEWRKLHNGELYDLHSFLTKCYSGDQIKKNEMGNVCGTYGREERDMVLMGKPGGKRRHWRFRRIYSRIKMRLRGVD